MKKLLRISAQLVLLGVLFGTLTGFTAPANASHAGPAGDLIMMWDGAGVPNADWVCISCVSGDPFFERFPRAAASYGGTLGADTASHTLSFVRSSGADGTTIAAGPLSVANRGHDHGFPNATTTSNSILPSYKQLKLIKYVGAGSVPSVLPAGIIGMFSSGSLPSDWTAYSDLNDSGRYLRGGGLAGFGGSASHDHTLTADITSFTTTDPATAVVPGSEEHGLDSPAPAHTHTISASSTIGPQSNLPSFVTVTFGKLAVDKAAPKGLIGMFNDTIIPANWNIVSNAAPYQNRLIRGSATPEQIGGSDTHNHGGQTVLGSGYSDLVLQNCSCVPTEGLVVFPAYAFGHTAEYNVSSGNSLPLYTNVVLAKFNPPATKIVFTTPVRTVADNNTASATITIETRTDINETASPANNTTVTLSTTDTRGSFRAAGNTCANPAITTVTILNTATSASFLYCSTTSGPAPPPPTQTYTMTADDTLPNVLTSGTQSINVADPAATTKLDITTAPFSVAQNSLSPAITVRTCNFDCSSSLAFGAGVTLSLSTTSAGGTFKLGSATSCADPSVTSLDPPDGDSSVSFKYCDSLYGTPTLTISESPDQLWQDAQQTETIADIIAPSTTIAEPAQTFYTSLNLFTDAYGTYSDNAGGSGVSVVLISIRRGSDNLYYNGITFASVPEVFLSTDLFAGEWRRQKANLPAWQNNITYTIKSRATDVAGNIESSPPTKSFIIDDTAPEPFGLISPPDGAETADPTPTFTWEASSDPSSGLYKYQLFVDGSLNRDSISPACSPCSTTPTADLSDGSHTWFIRAFDNAGNFRDSATRTFTVDSVAPLVSITSPPSGFTNSFIAVTGTASDAGTGVTEVKVSVLDQTSGKYFNGTAFTSDSEIFLTASGTTSWHLSVSGTISGHTYHIRAQSFDGVGNGSGIATRTFLFDATAPAPGPEPGPAPEPVPEPERAPEPVPEPEPEPEPEDTPAAILRRPFDAVLDILERVAESETARTATLALAPAAALVIPAAAIGLLNLPAYLLYLFTLLMQLLKIWKKPENWGTVYDSYTKGPLSGAKVQLFGQAVQTTFTDRNGRYGFFADPGSYDMVITLSGYVFPSSALMGDTDAQYENLYYGTRITLPDSRIISLNVPLDPKNIDLGRIRAIFSTTSLRRNLAFVALALSFFSATFAGYLYLRDPGWAHIALVLLYTVLFVINVRGFTATIRKPSPAGRVYDLETLEGIAGAVMKLFGSNKLVETRRSSSKGRYTFFSVPGTYQLKVDHPEYIFNPVEVKVRAVEIPYVVTDVGGSRIKGKGGGAKTIPPHPVSPEAPPPSSLEHVYRKTDLANEEPHAPPR